MTVLASFNYYPSALALILAGTLAIGVLCALALGRSVLRGVLVGGSSWGVIAWIAFGAGSGDLAGLLQMVYGGVFGIIGAVLGGVACVVGKILWPRQGRLSGRSRCPAITAEPSGETVPPKAPGL